MVAGYRVLTRKFQSSSPTPPRHLRRSATEAQLGSAFEGRSKCSNLHFSSSSGPSIESQNESPGIIRKRCCTRAATPPSGEHGQGGEGAEMVAGYRVLTRKFQSSSPTPPDTFGGLRTNFSSIEPSDRASVTFGGLRTNFSSIEPSDRASVTYS